MHPLIPAGLLLAAGLALFIGLRIRRRRKNRPLTRGGWLHDYGSYSHMSFDDGQTWHNAEYQPDGSLVPTGPADPELVRRLDGLDALNAHLTEHGPIDPTRNEQVALLQDAGFTLLIDGKEVPRSGS